MAETVISTQGSLCDFARKRTEREDAELGRVTFGHIITVLELDKEQVPVNTVLDTGNKVVADQMGRVVKTRAAWVNYQQKTMEEVEERQVLHQACDKF